MEELETQSTPLRSIPARLVQIVVSPGRLMSALKDEPRWAGALIVGALVVLVSTAVIPADIWAESLRQQMLESGQTVPEGVDVATVTRVLAPIGGAIFWFIYAFVIAGVVTVIFGFLLGDDGKFKQYLSVTAHAFLIMALGAIVTLPLKITERDLQLTLNVGLFMPFLERGYLLSFFTILDIFVLWSCVIVGLGIHMIDPRRGWAGAAGVLLVMTLGIFALFARFIPT